MALWQRLARVFGRRDRGSAREDAERILLEADFGVAATDEILEEVARVSDGEFRAALERTIARILTAAAPAGGDPGGLARAARPPAVMLVFGVNGVGKTTTIAKLAHRLAREGVGGGRSVLFAAADTFRAGAAEQLRIWAERLGVPCVGGRGDPAAVAFDAIAAARVRGLDRKSTRLNSSHTATSRMPSSA